MTVSYASITVAGRLTMADYQTVDERLGSPRAAGLVSEVAGYNNDGLHVITVWDSKADHERFVSERLIPAFQAAGVDPGPLSFTDLDVDAVYVRADDLDGAA
jgi:hypothetical protein